MCQVCQPLQPDIRFLRVLRNQDVRTYQHHVLRQRAITSQCHLEEKLGADLAPVFSSHGAVLFQLVLSGLPGSVAPRKLERYVERLSATAAAVTSQINGRLPSVRAAQAL